MSAAPEYRPTRWLPSGHAMTVASALLDRWRAPAPAAAERTFDTVPGTRVRGLWSPPPRPGGPLVVLLHGLTGHADCGYMRGAARHLIARGLGVLRLNTRNQGGTEALTDTLYHAGLTDDVKAVLQALADEGHPRLGVAGFSMGGNVALKALGEWGRARPAAVAAVAAVSPPVDLAAASDAIDSGVMNAMYQRAFLGALSALARRKAAAHPGRFDLTGLRRVRSLRAFDDLVVAPAFGFSSADDYYARASAAPVLDAIDVPALVVHAADDSIVPAGPLEAWAARHPGPVDLSLCATGGHVGFVLERGAARRAGGRFWAEPRLASFMASALSQDARGPA